MLKKHKWYVLSIIALILAEVGLVGGIGVWREYFWQAVQDKNLNNFFVLLSYFTVMALAACFVSGFNQYLVNYVSLLIRTDLTKRATTLDVKHIEGHEQRIQEDCFAYPQLAAGLLVSVLRSSLILSTFVVIITMQIGASYVLFPAIYALIGTGIAFKLARPLIDLNYINQVVEAKFRRYIGDFFAHRYEEVRSNNNTYLEVFKNNHNLFKATKKLSYFQSFYNQITVIVPYLLVFSLYFSGKIVFGVFMQVASSMAHIIDAMSTIINSFNSINNWLSCRKRLKEMGVI